MTNLNKIHDTVHEMARDEARHGKAFEGLLKRYFWQKTSRIVSGIFRGWTIRCLSSFYMPDTGSIQFCPAFLSHGCDMQYTIR